MSKTQPPGELAPAAATRVNLAAAGLRPGATRLSRYLTPLLLYLGSAIIFTWPLVLHLGDQVVLFESGDVWQHLWNNWWMRFSLLDLHTHPYTTPTLFHPVGANLYFHALDPLDGYISILPQLLFGLVASFNLVILFQLTLAGYGTFWLARYLTGSYSAALVAGLIYGCSPLVSRLLNLGQLELTAIEWLPLYMLCFIKTLNREARPWLWRSLSVLLLLALSLSTWYYLLYALIFSGLYLLYRLGQQRREWRRLWPGTMALSLGVLAVYGVLVLPVLLPTLHEAGAGGTRQPPFTLIYNSATIKGLFTTGPSLLWGWFGSGDNPEFRGNFLGYVALGLGLAGVGIGFRKNWFWAALALVFIVLALGPVLHFDFDPNWEPRTADNGQSLPGRWLYYLPFGNIARVPLRYSLVTMLALAVLSAYALAWVNRKLANRPAARVLVPVLAGLLVLLEFVPPGRRLADARIPSFYNQLKTEGNWNDFAILETPDRDVSVISKAMFYQSAHQHPIVGGYLSRKPDYPFRNFPGINELLNLDYRAGTFQRDIVERSGLRNAAGVLEFYNIRYVVVHPNLLRNEDERFNARSVLQTVFGAGTKPYFTDNELEVWKVPAFRQAGGRPEADKLLIQLAEGWGQRRDSSSGPEREVGSAARLAIFNPYREGFLTRITVPLRAAAGETKITVLVNGQSLTAQSVGIDKTNLAVAMPLNPGLNELIIQTGGTILAGPIAITNTN